MVRVTFTPQLERFLDAPPAAVAAPTVAAALDAVFHTNPRLRGYILDDHARLRPHINIFVDGTLLRDRASLLATRLEADAEITVMQALSGG